MIAFVITPLDTTRELSGLTKSFIGDTESRYYAGRFRSVQVRYNENQLCIIITSSALP